MVFIYTLFVSSCFKKNGIYCSLLFRLKIEISKTPTYLSIITGSDGVSFRFPQLFLSQHRLFSRDQGINRQTNHNMNGIFSTQSETQWLLTNMYPSQFSIHQNLFIWWIHFGPNNIRWYVFSRQFIISLAMVQILLTLIDGN